MAYTQTDLSSKHTRTLCRIRSFGVPTYWINSEPTCLCKTSSMDYCSLKAGLGTSHAGTESCKYHEGNAYNITTGRYAKVTKNRIIEAMEQHRNDPDALNLIPELAMLRGSLEVFIAGTDKKEMSDKTIGLILKTVDSIGSMVDKIDKIQSRQVLTAASARLLMLRAVDIAKLYIPEEKVGDFILAWKGMTSEYNLIGSGE